MFERLKEEQRYKLDCYRKANEIEVEGIKQLAAGKISVEWFDVIMSLAMLLRALPDMNIKEKTFARAKIEWKIKALKKK